MKRTITKEKAVESIAKINEARAALAEVVQRLQLLATLPLDEQTVPIDALIDEHCKARSMVDKLYLGALGVVTMCSDIETLAIHQAEHMLTEDIETVPSVAYSKAIVSMRAYYANGVCGKCGGKADVCLPRHAQGRSCP